MVLSLNIIIIGDARNNRAGLDQKVWEKPEWPAAFLSLALTQLEARWESLVSDIGMAGPPKNNFGSKGVG